MITVFDKQAQWNTERLCAVQLGQCECNLKKRERNPFSGLALLFFRNCQPALKPQMGREPESSKERPNVPGPKKLRLLSWMASLRVSFHFNLGCQVRSSRMLQPSELIWGCICCILCSWEFETWLSGSPNLFASKCLGYHNAFRVISQPPMQTLSCWYLGPECSYMRQEASVVSSWQ